MYFSHELLPFQKWFSCEKITLQIIFHMFKKNISEKYLFFYRLYIK